MTFDSSQAIDRAVARLEQTAPTHLATGISRWIRRLSGTETPGDYFRHPMAFPFLLVPIWLETVIHDPVDPAFQEDLIYSSVNAYYFTRMVDNHMDGDVDGEDIHLLSATAFFHMQFQLPYQKYFAYGHPFWTFFQKTWQQQAEAAYRDSQLANQTPEKARLISEEDFQNVVAQKLCGAKIPLAAVCYHYEREDVLDTWLRVVDVLSSWHMMLNDMFDWIKDSSHGNMTYFRSEAVRQTRMKLAMRQIWAEEEGRKIPRKKTESSEAWIIRKGIDWAMAKMAAWMTELQNLETESKELQTYLEKRHNDLMERRTKMEKGLQLMKALSGKKG